MKYLMAKRGILRRIWGKQTVVADSRLADLSISVELIGDVGREVLKDLYPINSQFPKFTTFLAAWLP